MSGSRYQPFPIPLTLQSMVEYKNSKLQMHNYRFAHYIGLNIGIRTWPNNNLLCGRSLIGIGILLQTILHFKPIILVLACTLKTLFCRGVKIYFRTEYSEHAYAIRNS